MQHITLNRQDHQNPNIGNLYEMLEELKGLLNEDVESDRETWTDNLKAILEFQTSEGDFSLLDSFKVESDARVDFCYTPTYICAAVLMKTLMTDKELLGDKGKEALAKALYVSCGRKLRGHGYEGLRGQIEALDFFIQAGLREFIIYYPAICPRFTAMIRRIAKEYADSVKKNEFERPWIGDCESEVRRINHYFSTYNVFVYGTLMNGQYNHNSYLAGAKLLGKATTEGYDMYDLGSFPGIVKGNGSVKGELYEMAAEDIVRLDYLEGEGSLYNRACVSVRTEAEENQFALIYEYARNVEGYELIPEWFQPYTADWKSRRDNYVWYVSYGSNMLYERFMCYIAGGRFKNADRVHPACRDTNPPIAKCTYEIPYNMYFGNNSSSWGGKGVCFIDTSMPGKALGVAYLISKEQFRHVSCQENGGAAPENSLNWYNEVVELGTKDGCKVLTITNAKTRPHRKPAGTYMETLREGLCENYKELHCTEIDAYLIRCANSKLL